MVGISTLLAESRLREVVAADTVISGGSEECVEGVKYDFRLGTRVLFGRRPPVDISALTETEKTQLFVRPGELVYVLTKERLSLPGNMKAELSNKRKLSHAGVLILGGFCVDPGYRGKLMFALYNISTTPFPLQPGKKLIAAQFYELSPEETPAQREIDVMDDFPDDIVRLMSIYEPASLDGVKGSVAQLSAEIAKLKTDFDKNQSWTAEFRNMLEENGRQVRTLTEGLREETANRKDAERDFRETLRDIQRRTTYSAATVGVVAALVVAVVSGLVTALIFHGVP